MLIIHLLIFIILIQVFNLILDFILTDHKFTPHTLLKD